MTASRFLVVILGCALGWLPVAPPEHVHEHEESGHAHVVVHRHAVPHEALTQTAHHGVSIGDHDEPILTLDSPYHAPVRVLISPPVLAVIKHVEPSSSPSVRLALADVGVLIHGPPRAPAGLRAPPIAPAL